MQQKIHRKQIEEMVARLGESVLAERNRNGQWDGNLSSSALSTATAVIALSKADSEEHEAAISSGLDWLMENQNKDGGWGDTIISFSNISTSVLCWAALSFANTQSDRSGEAAAHAENYIRAQAGGLETEKIVAAILRRYGKDRTFSIPILSACALSERFGDGSAAWRQIPPLPFELAACPHRWFQWVKLPVVSYALPALIALGQVRHFFRPTRNPITRLLRNLARRKTLQVLEAIQPESGGYLEAAPLTSFVLMSLSGMGLSANITAVKATTFLVQSQRDDGSWPIDVNLRTWVTTLAVNAMGKSWPSFLAESESRALAGWLRKQQYTREHPFTHAAPGGWAWTDLPGGVPDADDTPGALLALHSLESDNPDAQRAAERGLRWLADLQNSDGGIPTFCRGWGHLPFDQSSPDLTAHTVRAFHAWKTTAPHIWENGFDKARDAMVAYLKRTQLRDGSWLPLWFGNQFAPDDINPVYGTSRVLMSYAAIWAESAGQIRGSLLKACEFLCDAQSQDGGWGGIKGAPCSIEETAVSIDALAKVLCAVKSSSEDLPATEKAAIEAAMLQGTNWLFQETAGGSQLPASPIGFYFAKLWYYEKLYPLLFALSALEQVKRFLSYAKTEG